MLYKYRFRNKKILTVQRETLQVSSSQELNPLGLVVQRNAERFSQELGMKSQVVHSKAELLNLELNPLGLVVQRNAERFSQELGMKSQVVH